MIELETLKLEQINYDNKEHLIFLKGLMQSKDMKYLWDLSDKELYNNQNDGKYIVVNEEDKYIGYLNLSNPTEAVYGKTVSLYYAVGENHRGKEYGKRIINETKEWLFNEKEIDCIVAQVDINNNHSINTLIKSGMTQFNHGDDEYTTFIQRK